MKKSSLIISILLVASIIILILSFFNKKNDKEIAKIDYTSNIVFTNEEQLLAIAYLNDINEVSSKYINDLENIKVYKISGEESYLIIPRYDDIEINIYESFLENNMLVKGNLISTTNLPFVIICNNSNIILEIKYNDNLFEYSPSINLENDSINMNEYVLDITK